MASTPFAQHASTGPVPTQAAPPPPPGGQNRRPRLWPLALGAALLTVAAIAATAAITYAIARSTTEALPAAEPSAPAVIGPQYSPDEQEAAKHHLCSVFDASTKGQEGQGGLRIDGNPNTPLLLRKLTGIVAVESDLTKAPNDIADAVRRYVDANLEQMNAALGDASVDDINTLTASANETSYALADACGLPR